MDRLAEAGVGVAEDRQRGRAASTAACSANSVWVSRPMSGNPAQPADSAPPERYTAGKPSRSASLAVSALNAPGIMIGPACQAARNRAPGVVIVLLLLVFRGDLPTIHHPGPFAYNVKERSPRRMSPAHPGGEHA